jgi:hypothetical protein
MATTAHTEVPGEHKGAFPPFNSQTFASQLVWLVIIFVLLYAIMAKVALPRRRHHRAAAKHIDDDLAQAGAFKAQSMKRCDTRRRWLTPAPAPRRSPTRCATSRLPKRQRVVKHFKTSSTPS